LQKKTTIFGDYEKFQYLSRSDYYHRRYLFLVISETIKIVLTIPAEFNEIRRTAATGENSGPFGR
jgi:hypothetical protein